MAADSGGGREGSHCGAAGHGHGDSTEALAGCETLQPQIPQARESRATRQSDSQALEAAVTVTVDEHTRADEGMSLAVSNHASTGNNPFRLVPRPECVIVDEGQGRQQVSLTAAEESLAAATQVREGSA